MGASGDGPAPRDDLRFRVLELRRDPAGHTREQRRVVVSGQRVGESESSGGPVDVSVLLETVSDGVRVAGSVAFEWVGSCRRCLEVAKGDGTSDFEELFVDDPDRWVPGADAEADEVHPIEQGWIDLSHVVRDTVSLGLPLAPLCRPDCDGPDPDGFPVAVAGEAPQDSDPADLGDASSDDGDEPPMDPRWAKLSEVRFEPEEGQSPEDQ